MIWTPEGAILYETAIAKSGRLGIGKVENYSYDIYKVQFIPEALFGSPYRKSLTTLFPYHEEDISAYFKNIFGYEGCVAESAEKMIALFEEMGIDIHFEGDVDEERTRQISIDSMLKQEKITQIYIIGE